VSWATDPSAPSPAVVKKTHGTERNVGAWSARRCDLSSGIDNLQHQKDKLPRQLTQVCAERDKPHKRVAELCAEESELFGEFLK
jgi:hypothetical protein